MSMLSLERSFKNLNHIHCCNESPLFGCAPTGLMNLCKTCSIRVPRQCHGNSIIFRRQEKVCVAQNAKLPPRNANAKDVICVRVCKTFGPCHPDVCRARVRGRQTNILTWLSFSIPSTHRCDAPNLETSSVRFSHYTQVFEGGQVQLFVVEPTIQKYIIGDHYSSD